jgi:hypothetical protein
MSLPIAYIPFTTTRYLDRRLDFTTYLGHTQSPIPACFFFSQILLCFNGQARGASIAPGQGVSKWAVNMALDALRVHFACF